jgi:UDP-GlcNAc:undecaprenyl-phosphate GlcNAc-1-phosphate transferase
MFVSIAPFVAAAVALGLTPLVQKSGLKWGWVDQPGKRKVHQQPIVRVGGIAIFTATVVTILLVLVGSGIHNVTSTPLLPIAGILLGGAGFFLIGLIDDIFHLSPFIRLFFQGLVVCLSWSLGVSIETLPIPFVGAVPTGLLSLPVTFLWLAGVANAINWMDGLDGLAGGISTIAALALGLICWQNPFLALFALTLTGALTGFLRYNLNPARIYMGDGGSYFIGFTLAAIAAVGLMQTSDMDISVLPFWILAVPIFDMLRVILSRLWDRKSPFFADQRHLHHKLLRANFSVVEAVKFIWCLSAWFASWALFIAGTPGGAIALVLTTCSLMGASLPLWISTVPVPVKSR